MTKWVKRIIFLLCVGGIAIYKRPDTPLWSYQFLIWITLILVTTSFLPQVFLKEKTGRIFELISIENLKQAPISGVSVYLLMTEIAILILGGSIFSVIYLFKFFS